MKSNDIAYGRLCVLYCIWSFIRVILHVVAQAGYIACGYSCGLYCMWVFMRVVLHVGIHAWLVTCEIDVLLVMLYFIRL